IYACLELCGLLQVNQFLDLFHGLSDAGDGGVLLEGADEDLGFLDVAGAVVRPVHEQLVEEVAAPLDTVLDLTGEVTQSTHWDGLLRRVLRVTIALGLIGDNHL
ncbi:MAG: hypothetical protein ACK56F_22865, partial [bacterium]